MLHSAPMTTWRDAHLTQDPCTGAKCAWLVAVTRLAFVSYSVNMLSILAGHDVAASCSQSRTVQPAIEMREKLCCRKEQPCRARLYLDNYLLQREDRRPYYSMYLHCRDEWPDTAPLYVYLPHHRNFTCFIVVDEVPSRHSLIR